MYKKKLHLITLLFIFISGSLFAQMSDQQIIQELTKYQNNGMSQQQIAVEMSKKGVTPSQLQRIRDQYLSEEGSTSSVKQPGNASQNNVLREEMDALTFASTPLDTIKPENKIYGQGLFSKRDLTFAPNMNMPTPANYVLGTGDEILIDIWGDSELNVRYTISPDGYITIPGLGRIQISGLNVQQAKSRLRGLFSRIYSDLESSEPHTFLGMSVGNVRSIKVNVMGEVNTPGTYTLSSFSSAFHALYAAGGTTNIGSLRNIRIFRSGKAIGSIDLYNYLLKGNNMEDLTLQEGDIVMVEPYGILVQATGEVKRPMWYEVKADETLQDLIQFAGGYSPDAYQNTITLLRKGVDEMEAYTLSENQYGSFTLQNGDKVEVGNILDRISNMVEITGAVYRPGKYAIGDQIKTIQDLINIAQGPTGDAYLQRALLYRENEDLTRTMQSFDLNALLSNQISDITLKKNDYLYIPSLLTMDDSLSVYIGGEVRKPDMYSYADNMRLEDIILQAGGLTEAASTARVDVYRRIKDPSRTSVSNNSGSAFSFKLINGEIVSNDPNFVLMPFDQIVVRRSPGYEIQQNVTIQGEVLFEGEYTKLQKNERLTSFIERAGGLTPYAYIKGARLSRRLTSAEQQRSREALRVKAEMDKLGADSLTLAQINNIDLSTQYIGINLEKALKNPGNDADIILKDGDILEVPVYNGIVKISGAILYPNTVTYAKNKNLGYYISQAGGYSRLAIKSRPFVIYMNGQVATGRRAKIEPGCEIVVPEKPDREPMGLQGILSLGTSLTTVALLISNLLK